MENEVLKDSENPEPDQDEGQDHDVPEDPTKKKSGATTLFHVDTSAIQSVPEDEQAEELRGLGLSVYNQMELEQGIMHQLDEEIERQEKEKRQKNAAKEMQSVQDEIKFVKKRINAIDQALNTYVKEVVTKEVRKNIEMVNREKENKLKQLKKLEAKKRALLSCLEGQSAELMVAENETDELDEETKLHLEHIFGRKETDEELLIRTGQMTPFGTVTANTVKPKHVIRIPEEMTDFEKYLMSEAENKQLKLASTTPKKKMKPKVTFKFDSNRWTKDVDDYNISQKIASEDSRKSISSTDDSDLDAVPSTSKDLPILIPKKKRKRYRKENIGTGVSETRRIDFRKVHPLNESFPFDAEVDDAKNGDVHESAGSDEEYRPDDDELMELDEDERKHKTKSPKRKSGKADDSDDDDDDVPWVEVKNRKDGKKSADDSPSKRLKKEKDDGELEYFIKRLKAHRRKKLEEKQKRICDGLDDSSGESCVEIDDEFKVPSVVWSKLYRYQQTCVRWLWELHQQNCGGILGDEMGLGKTIQVIAFLAGLQASNLRTVGDKYKGLGPVVLVCPATVMHQWVKEFHKWWPPLRVAVLHDSGSFCGNKEALVRNINKEPGVLITSYAGVSLHSTILLQHEWHYVILDEGHKIRNPDAQATLASKQFRTPHRLILSGSPIQNSLRELWSLFDFVYPGKLGTLPVFMQEFAVPITQGGYSNASEVQVQTAYKCASVLRDTIKPYLLRRMKDDVKVNLQLPNKNEQVLFCSLTEHQREMYKSYIDSPEIANILNGRLKIFVGLINLRKICNHPDLYDGGPKIFKNTDVSALSQDMRYGYSKRSGKMMVVDSLLKLWKKQGHRVLLFTQSKQMLDILVHFAKTQGYTHMVMDGTTPISARQPAINKFNKDDSIFLFILTTRVGGLGVNLTGGNRVIIYDPDWNPSTDTQARERSWRIGQQKDVTIYRLLTSGTIEEKIYHRQIFKQFVTNRVLKDPKQRRFFKSNDLHELFTLADDKNDKNRKTETSVIFAGTGSEVKPKHLLRKKPHPAIDASYSKPKAPAAKSQLSSEKIEKMKELARKLSKQISQKVPTLDGKTDSLENDIKQKGIEVKTEVTDLDGLKRLHSAQKLERKRKKKKRGAVIEGEHIDLVVKQDVYQPSINEDEEREKKMREDDYVLHKLFKKSGVHSALKHDTIMDSADPDYLLVEAEANRVAKEAIKKLKQSRRQCLRAEAGVPTWTGVHGASGAPGRLRFGQKKAKIPSSGQSGSKNETSSTDSSVTPEPSTSGIKRMSKPKPGSVFSAPEIGEANSTSGPPSSSDLLARIKARNPLPSHDDGNSEEEMEMTTTTTEHDELLVDIRNFVAFQASVDGQATTGEILQAFRDKLPKENTSVFKALLNKICDFYRLPNGDGVWRLKPEFR